MSRIIVDSIRNSSASADGITLASDGSVTLPGNATCSGTATGFGGGKLVNYSSTTKTDQASASCAQGGMTGDMFSVSYAAASSSNKLLFLNSIGAGGQTAVFLNFFIGGSQSVAGIRGDQDSDSSTQRCAAVIYGYGDSSVQTTSHNFLLSSPSTSSTTYSYRFSHGTTSTRTLWINKGVSYGNYNYEGTVTSCITILEFEP